MEMVWKGIVGGLMTAAIVWLSKRGNTLPGILPLFPTFALIALLVVGAKGDNAGFREACVAGAKTIPAYLAFLGVCYLVVDRIDYRLALLGGLTAWLAVALGIFFAPRWT
jgi:membrane protein GlpM